MDSAQNQLRYLQGRRIVLAGVVVNICLTFVKVMGGVLGHSHALVADGVHSLSDLATDLVVYFGLRYSSKPRDANHPYGHGKIETLASTMVGGLLVLTGLLLGYGAVQSGLDRTGPTPDWTALVVAVISIIFKEGLYRYTLVYARRINSSALLANAWHHRSDALSSVAALGGIIGARMGLPFLDPVAAIIVALMIVKVGGEIVFRAARELVEETVQDEQVSRLLDEALAVDGVLSVPEIHSRYVGPSMVVDMSIMVDGELTVARGHEIAHQVEQALIKNDERVAIVSVHVEPQALPVVSPPGL